MRNISYKYIITEKRLVDTPSKINYVLEPEQNQYEGCKVLRTHIYKLVCGKSDYEIVCAEISKDKIKHLIVAEFIIPNRPYPVYVYIYAVMLYSLNYEMGQRKAAELTRTNFGLATFSHTTLGRALKRIELRIVGEQSVAESEPQMSTKAFPTVEQTHDRRSTVSTFLVDATCIAVKALKRLQQSTRNCRRPPYVGEFFDVCHKVVRHMFLKYGKLLL